MEDEKEFGEPGTYEELFEECFREFEESGYDLALINKIEEKVVSHMRAIAQKTGKTQRLNYPIRLALEYIVRRVPKEDRILQELLLERIRDFWKQRHIRMERESNQELLKHHSQAFERVVNKAIGKVFYELRAYQIITKDRLEFYEDGTILYPEVSGDRIYEFGAVKDGVLFWIENLNQLAYALFEIRSLLDLPKISPGKIVEYIENSGVIELRGGLKFGSLETYLKELKGGRQDFERKTFVSNAAGLIFILLKQKEELSSEDRS